MTTENQKIAAARAALEYVKPGMAIGLGTGTTSQHFINLLAERVKEGLDVVCVPTSDATRRQAESLGIPLTTLDQKPQLDYAIDGADEFDPDYNLIKGGGGALLFEKIVASSARYMIAMVDESKKVETLGRFPLPVEVVPFGVKATAWKIERAMRICGLKGSMTLRVRDGKPYRTDGGHAIVDIALGRIPQPERFGNLLSIIPGVVDHGLFLGICGIVLMGTDNGVVTLRKQ